VVAYLALFVALGGSSYAAVKVGSAQIVNNSVASKDVRNESITGADVKNRSLLARDFKAGQLPAGQTGPQGPQGAPGSPAGSVIAGSTAEQLLTTFTSEERFPPSGFAPTEALVNGVYWQMTPNTPIVVRDLVGRFASAPGPGGGRFVNLVNMDANAVVLTCQVLNAATTCNSGNQSATLPPGTRYYITLFTGNPGPGPSLGAAWSFRALTP
jgi:hypothetical protein